MRFVNNNPDNGTQACAQYTVVPIIGLCRKVNSAAFNEFTEDCQVPLVGSRVYANTISTVLLNN